MARALDRKVSYLAVSNDMFIKALLAQGFSNFDVSHFRYYAEEMRKGAYAIGAPTDHILEVTGQLPENFDVITRRYATLPKVRRTLTNKGRALSLMIKMIATRVPALDQWEQKRDHPFIANGMLAQDNPDWLATAERQQPNLLYLNTEKSRKLQEVESMVV